MANPKFRSGPITFKAGAALKQFRLVKLDSAGKLAHAGAADKPHGVVTEQAAPAGPRDTNDLSLGLPEDVAVHIGGVVAISTDEEEITAGAAIYAAADGKAAATGTVVVGWAAGPASGGRVAVVLQLPAQA